VRFLIRPDGFSFRTAFTRSGFARWSDVRAIEWSSSASWFVISVDGGKRVRVSILVLGLDNFCRALLRNCPVELGPPTRAALERAAAGLPMAPPG
jgi:hypothetical protein